jgi:hypothetical protein
MSLSRLVGPKPLKLGMLGEHSMLLLDLDPNYDNFLTAEDFEILVKTLVDCGLLALDPTLYIVSSHPSSFPSSYYIFSTTLLTNIKYKRLVQKIQCIILQTSPHNISSKHNVSILLCETLFSWLPCDIIVPPWFDIIC